MKTRTPPSRPSIPTSPSAPPLRVALGIVVAASLLALSSCSTMAGLGQDIQKVGEEVEEAAY